MKPKLSLIMPTGKNAPIFSSIRCQGTGRIKWTFANPIFPPPFRRLCRGFLNKALPCIKRGSLRKSFASRVASSLLNAIHLPELIVYSREDYERSAIKLATDPAKLAEIREKLANNRLTAPLFDTPLFTRHLEAAYGAMYHRYQAGAPLEPIDVQDPVR